MLIVVGRRLVEKLFDYIGELLRQCLAHFRAGILRRDSLAYAYQPMKRDVIKILKVGLFRLLIFEFTLRIVNQRTQRLNVLFSHRIAEKFRHFSADVS